MSVFEKVSQPNSRLNTLDTLTVVVYSVSMPVGFGFKTKVDLLSVMAHLKKSIIVVNAEKNCLVHVMIIASAKVTNNPKYKAYRQDRKIYPAESNLMETG